MKRISLLLFLLFLSSCSPHAEGVAASTAPPEAERSQAPASSAACRTETGMTLPSATITDTFTPTFTETLQPTPAETPNPSPRLSPTKTLTPSETLTPSRTFTPTKSPFATEWPPLAYRGPYLAYGSRGEVVLLNPDGSGRKLVKIPDGWGLTFAPGGKWGLLTEDRGSVFDYEYADTYLKLMRVSDGSVRSLGLIATGETFESYDCYEGMWFSGYQIAKGQWSPDGRYFAFTADPTGESVDLYVFDTVTGVKRQLTKSIGDVAEISWSPDGRRILFKSGRKPITGMICCYSDTRLNVTRPENGVNQGILELPVSEGYCFADLSGGGAMRAFHRWIGPGTLLAYRLEWTGNDYVNPLTLIDIDSKESRIIWHGSMLPWEMEYDPEEKTLLLYEWGDADSTGFYLLTLDGETRLRFDFNNSSGLMLLFRGGADDRFLIRDGTGVFAVARDGAVRKISDRSEATVRFSPDYRRMILSGTDGIDLFNEKDELAAHSDLAPGSIVWRPDGAGFYFTAKADGAQGLYYWRSGDSAPGLIFSLPAENPYAPSGNLVWLE